MFKWVMFKWVMFKWVMFKWVMFKWVIAWYQRVGEGEIGEVQVCHTACCDFCVNIPKKNFIISVKVFLGSVIWMCGLSAIIATTAVAMNRETNEAFESSCVEKEIQEAQAGQATEFSDQ